MGLKSETKQQLLRCLVGNFGQIMCRAWSITYIIKDIFVESPQASKDPLTPEHSVHGIPEGINLMNGVVSSEMTLLNIL